MFIHSMTPSSKLLLSNDCVSHHHRTTSLHCHRATFTDNHPSEAFASRFWCIESVCVVYLVPFQSACYTRRSVAHCDDETVESACCKSVCSGRSGLAPLHFWMARGPVAVAGKHHLGLLSRAPDLPRAGSRIVGSTFCMPRACITVQLSATLHACTACYPDLGSALCRHRTHVAS